MSKKLKREVIKVVSRCKHGGNNIIVNLYILMLNFFYFTGRIFRSPLFTDLTKNSSVKVFVYNILHLFLSPDLKVRGI